jgi:hypothetical protein
MASAFFTKIICVDLRLFFFHLCPFAVSLAVRREKKFAWPVELSTLRGFSSDLLGRDELPLIRFFDHTLTPDCVSKWVRLVR